MGGEGLVQESMEQNLSSILAEGGITPPFGGPFHPLVLYLCPLPSSLSSPSAVWVFAISILTVS